MLWLLVGGMATAEVARVTRDSVRWVQEMARRDRAGADAIADRRHDTPGAAPFLDQEQPEQPDPVRVARAGSAPDGGIGRCRRVAAWRSQDGGHPVRVQRGWNGGVAWASLRTDRDPGTAARLLKRRQRAQQGGVPPPSRR